MTASSGTETAINFLAGGSVSFFRLQAKPSMLSICEDARRDYDSFQPKERDMAERKSFLKTATESDAFARRLAEAAKIGVSEAQLAEQRISFAYGNAPARSSGDKASVREASKHNKLIRA